MKVPTLFVSLVLASIVAAQGIDKLPDCAQDCANGFLEGGIGDCGTGDVKCICENKSFLGSIACCLEDACGKSEQSSAVAYASTICMAFAITDLPTSVSCTSTAGSGTASTPASTTPANAAATTTSSGNYGPRQTAQAGLGALGGIVAAAIML